MRFYGLLLCLLSAWVNGAEHEITLSLGEGELYGSVLMPDNGAKAIVFIHPGSGPTDRDGNSKLFGGANNSLKYLAQDLAKQGIASVRIDKRSVGKSLKTPEHRLRFETYVADSRAWLKKIQGSYDLPLFALGHSEGALITILAAQSVNLQGVIHLSGPSRSAADLIEQQLRRQKIDPARLQSALSNLNQLRRGQRLSQPDPAFKVLFRPSVQDYLISWFQYQPLQEAKKLTQPVLFIYGETDRQVAPDAAQLLKQQIPKANSVVIKGMNHVLKPVSGSLAEQMPSYWNPDIQLAPGLVDSISQFVVTNIR